MVLVAPWACAAPADDAAARGLVFLASLPADGQMAPYLVEAAVATGLDPRAWPSGHAALDDVPRNASGQAALRPLYALALAGAAPSDGPGRILATFRDGQFGDAALRNDDAWSILALSAAHARDERIGTAALRLAAQQDPQGGWSWSDGGAADVDTTGMVLEALRAADHLDAGVVQRAASWLAGQRVPGGGFPSEPGQAANCDSTAWAIRGLRAAGAAVAAETWTYLVGLQQADGGFAYQVGGTSNALCTAEAVTVLGLAGARASSAPPQSTPMVAPQFILVGLGAMVTLRRGRAARTWSAKPAPSPAWRRQT